MSTTEQQAAAKPAPTPPSLASKVKNWSVQIGALASDVAAVIAAVKGAEPTSLAVAQFSLSTAVGAAAHFWNQARTDAHRVLTWIHKHL